METVIHSAVLQTIHLEVIEIPLLPNLISFLPTALLIPLDILLWQPRQSAVALGINPSKLGIDSCDNVSFL